MGLIEDENGDGERDGFDESDEIADDDTVVLIDAEGNEREYVILAIFEVEDQDYAMLTPADQVEAEDSDELEVFLFEYHEDEDGTANFAGIEDEPTYEKVKAVGSTLMEQAEVDEGEGEGEE